MTNPSVSHTLKPTLYIIIIGDDPTAKRRVAREMQSALLPFGAAVLESFMAPIKHIVSASLAMRFKDVKKDIPLSELNGYTVGYFFDDIRRHIREKFGADVFGKWLMHRVLRNPVQKPPYVIIDDGGWPDDMILLPNKIVVCVGEPKLKPKGLSPDYVVNARNGDRIFSEVKAIVMDVINPKVK